jgi:uncharacterized protein YodC (DUF2158 family)
MRKMATFLILLITAVAAPGQFALLHAKAPETAPAFETTPSEERLERFRRGEMFTDGGDLKKGVWGEMDGVIEAPPKIVWRLFVQANEWKSYHFPELADSRAVPEDVAQQAESVKKVEDFYKLLGNQTYDPMRDQKPGTVWINATFQYYDLPWPVSNRWIVLRNSNDETQSAKGVYRCTWEKRAGNVRTMSGEFRLEPFEGNPNRTLMLYRVETDPGASVPRFLMKWGVKKSLPAAMRIIRRESAKLYARPSPLLHIQSKQPPN